MRYLPGAARPAGRGLRDAMFAFDPDAERRTLAEIDSTFRRLDGQTTLSRGRVVDQLLDLFNAAPSAAVRALISDEIVATQRLGLVPAQRVRTLLHEITAAVTIETLPPALTE